MTRKYWKGSSIDTLDPHQIFVFGSNPEGRHGKGAALAAQKFGAQLGCGRGLMGQTFALVTKNLKEGFVEKSTGITYFKEGLRSVSPLQIKDNIDHLYNVAKAMPDKEFLITYQYSTDSDDQPSVSLNGYSCEEMVSFFVRKNIPANVVFHESFKPFVEEGLAVEADKPENRSYVYFWEYTSPFSNFYPSVFTCKGLTFISTEQFIMYCKALTFGDTDKAAEIMDASNYPWAAKLIEGSMTASDILKDPVKASQWKHLMMVIKKKGREVSNYDDKVWASKRANIAFRGILEKFSQNLDIKQIMLDTKDAYFVEASPTDGIWGIKMSAEAAKKVPPSLWKGLNLLGSVLDAVKARLIKESTPA